MHRHNTTTHTPPPLILLLLAVLTTAVYGDWEELAPVPWGVEDGAGIIYGEDRIWGIFPDTDSGKTNFAAYNPHLDSWLLPPDSALEYLANSALTFQTLENGAVFLIGNEPEEPPVLYSYDLGRQSWVSRSIDSFLLGPGASLAYVPNLAYNRQLYPVPGWLYCLPGGPEREAQFWCYSIPSSLKPVALDGISPAEGAVIAEVSPLFIWPSAPGQPGIDEEYWLLVASESTFISPLVSIQTDEPQYQTLVQLPDGTIYWRTAYGDGQKGWVWGDVHSFVLQSGWRRLPDIPAPAVGVGAALAYEDDYFGMIYDLMHCLIAFAGEGDDGFYQYDRSSMHMWSMIGSPTPFEQRAGTAIATHIHGGFTPGYRPKAISGGNGNFWEFRISPIPSRWHVYDTLPDLPGPGASLAWSADDHVYLVLGEDEQGRPRNGFYRTCCAADDEGDRGAQGWSADLLPGHARLIHVRDRVRLEYRLADPSRVRISVHDVLGRRQKMLYSGHQPAGTHQATWDLTTGGTRVAPGAYFVLIEAGLWQAKLKVVVR